MALTKIKLDDVDPKAAPVISDEILISDSEDGGRGKLVTGTALKALIGGGVTIEPSGTDDTVALQAAIDAGGVVILSANATYLITQITISNRVILLGNGATLVNAENRKNYPIVITADNTVIYDLNLNITTTNISEHGSGIILRAKHVTLERIRIYADHADCGRLSGASYALWVQPSSDDLVLRDFSIKNFAYGIKLNEILDDDKIYRTQVNNLSIDTYVIGMTISNGASSRFTDINIFGLSPSYATTTPAASSGKNGILISSVLGVSDLMFRNVSIKNSIEHGFRIGGAASTTDVTISGLTVENAGNNSSSTGAHGFKLGGDTSSANYNIKNVTLTNYIYTQNHLNATGSGFELYKAENVSICGFVISGLSDKKIYQGGVITGVKNLTLSNGIIQNASYAGTMLYGYINGSYDFGTNENVIIRDIVYNTVGTYAISFETNATSAATKTFTNIDIKDISINGATYCLGVTTDVDLVINNTNIDRWSVVNASKEVGRFIGRPTLRSLLATTVPTTGTYNIGEIVTHTDPAPGEYVGWVFTSSGMKGFGAIETP